MRIFNGTNSLLTLPLSGNQKLEILPKSVSTEFMGSTDFLSMVVTSLSNEEIAIIVSGPYELNVCANIPTAVNYVVQTLDDAIIRFGLKKSEPEVVAEPEVKEEEKPTEPEPEPTSQEVVIEEPKVEEEPVVEEKPTKKSKKKAKK
jgi:hypothetical protein